MPGQIAAFMGAWGGAWRVASLGDRVFSGPLRSEEFKFEALKRLQIGATSDRVVVLSHVICDCVVLEFVWGPQESSCGRKAYSKMAFWALKKAKFRALREFETARPARATLALSKT